ncbi:MAG: DUF481 domain-containing protein [Terriglobia bacterium]
MKHISWLVLVVSLIAIPASADVLALKNGERLVGSWVTVKGGNLTFKSDTLGETTIPLSKVKSFSSTTPAVIVKTDNSTVRGELKLQPSGDWQVTSGGKSRLVPASSVAVIMPQTTYTSLVEHHAALYQDWKGAANFGYNLQRGDQQTGTISATVAATRERPQAPIFIRHWRTNYSLLMLFSKAAQNGLEIRSDTISTNLRQDYLITPSDFFFGFGQLDHIQAQGLYLRQTYGGGFGHDFIHTARTHFSGLGGLTFVNTKFYTGGPATQSAEALLGENLTVALTKRIALNHDFNFYPNLSNTGEYHFDTTTGLNIRLASRLSANVSFVDLFLSNPAPGSHKNNVAFTTGLGVTF